MVVHCRWFHVLVTTMLFSILLLVAGMNFYFAVDCAVVQLCC